MKTITNDYKENVKLFGRQIDSKIIYELDGDEIELGAEELNSITPHYESTILKSVMKQLDIDSNVEIPIGTVLEYQFGVYTGSQYEYISYGNYVVYKAEKQEDTKSWKLTCYDKMLYSMIPYESLNVTYPVTVKNYIIAICDKLGLDFANINDTFVNYDKEITGELYLDANGNSLDYTFRDVLDELAQVTASVICINNDDELEIRYVNNTGETETVEGTNLSLENVDDGVNIEYILKGNTSQNGTPALSSPVSVETVTGRQLISVSNGVDTKSYEINLGKNLWHFDSDDWYRSNNTSYVINDENSLTVTSTNNSYANTAFKLNLENGTYTFSLGSVVNTNESMTTKRMSLTTFTNGTRAVVQHIDMGTPQTVTITNEDNKQYVLEFWASYSSALVNSAIFTNIQVEKGNVASNFSPYKTPIELCKIGNYRDRIFKTTGINLFDKDNVRAGYRFGSDGDYYATTGFNATEFIKVEPSTTYSVSWTLIWSEVVCTYDINKQFKRRINSGTSFTTNNDEYFVRADVSDGNLPKAQINKGTTLLHYEPFGSGKWYLEKQVGKIVLNGSENWGKSGASTSSIFVGGTNITNAIDGNGLSNLFIYSSQVGVGYFTIYNNGANLRLCVDNNTISTIEAFKNWLSTHNTIVYYVLATPTTTEITDTELLSQLKNVKLLDGLNNVSISSSNLSSPLRLTYTPEIDMIDEEYLKDVNVNFG